MGGSLPCGCPLNLLAQLVRFYVINSVSLIEFPCATLSGWASQSVRNSWGLASYTITLSVIHLRHLASAGGGAHGTRHARPTGVRWRHSNHLSLQMPVTSCEVCF